MSILPRVRNYPNDIKLDEGLHVRGCWDGLSHVDKLKMVCTLYKLLEALFPLPYNFGIILSPWLMKCVHLVSLC